MYNWWNSLLISYTKNSFIVRCKNSQLKESFTLEEKFMKREILINEQKLKNIIFYIFENVFVSL